MAFLSLEKITSIFENYLIKGANAESSKSRVAQLVKKSIQINQELWRLEDLARIQGMGVFRIASIKHKIDAANQKRNDLIYLIDLQLQKRLNKSKEVDAYYSESPGMIIDRLGILYIKSNAIRELLCSIKEEEVRSDYLDKGKTIALQIEKLSLFLELYLKEINSGKVSLWLWRPVKIYNDKRIRKYIAYNVRGRHSK